MRGVETLGDSGRNRWQKRGWVVSDLRSLSDAPASDPPRLHPPQKSPPRQSTGVVAGISGGRLARRCAFAEPTQRRNLSAIKRSDWRERLQRKPAPWDLSWCGPAISVPLKRSGWRVDRAAAIKCRRSALALTGAGRAARAAALEERRPSGPQLRPQTSRRAGSCGPAADKRPATGRQASVSVRAAAGQPPSRRCRSCWTRSCRASP